MRIGMGGRRRSVGRIGVGRGRFIGLWFVSGRRGGEGEGEGELDGVMYCEKRLKNVKLLGVRDRIVKCTWWC